MKSKILFVISFSLAVVQLTGQETREHDPFYTYESVPSSPEAASLGQYGQINASPYNGKANITIPIYTIDFEGLKIPIQLSYDSGGVKVTQAASWVGLNWELSTSNGISRRIYGFDDFSQRIGGQYLGAPQNGYIYNQILPELEEGEARANLDYQDILNVHHSFSIQTIVGNGTRYLDTQPDVFNVNVFGQSYSFVLGRVNTILKHPL